MKHNLSQLPAAGILVLAALIPGAILVAGGGHDAEIREIRAVEARWNQEFETRDQAKLLAHYDDDATVIAPGMPAFHGKEAIRSMVQAMAADKALTLKFQAMRVRIASSGDVGWTEGSYRLTMTDPETGKPVESSGSYVTVYHREHGEWKAVSDIASPGPSPAGKTKENSDGRGKENHER